ncbi:MAG: phosphatidate cytidylyltransferase [Acidobacteriota bacterium]|nr:phosphatidate cytidylyltransferase [Acidobacteriota bacterium]
MKRVVTALILAPVVLALVFFAPKWLFMLALAGVAVLAGWEMLALTHGLGARPPRIAVCSALFLLFAISYEWPEFGRAVFGMLCIALITYCTFRSPIERILADCLASVFCMFYIGVTLMALADIRDMMNGPSLVVFLLCTVWAGDITALYVGRAFGKRKLAPHLSPKKTWAGAYGSIAGSMLVAGLLMGLAALLARWNSTRLFYGDEAWWYWLILAAIVNVAAQVGDLAESGLKRSAGVKDSGSLLPGHGGVLDRIDALLLAAPVLWYVQLIRLPF